MRRCWSCHLARTGRRAGPASSRCLVASTKSSTTTPERCSVGAWRRPSRTLPCTSPRSSFASATCRALAARSSQTRRSTRRLEATVSRDDSAPLRLNMSIKANLYAPRRWQPRTQRHQLLPVYTPVGAKFCHICLMSVYVCFVGDSFNHGPIQDNTKRFSGLIIASAGATKCAPPSGCRQLRPNTAAHTEQRAGLAAR